MEKTIDEQIRDLVLQKQKEEDAKLNETIYAMFSVMTKEEVLAKIGEMMNVSLALKMEVKRLLIDKPLVDNVTLPTDEPVV